MVYEQGTGENRGENRIGGELAIRAKRKVRRRVKGRDNQTKIKVMLGVLALKNLKIQEALVNRIFQQ